MPNPPSPIDHACLTAEVNLIRAYLRRLVLLPPPGVSSQQTLSNLRLLSLVNAALNRLAHPRLRR